MYLFLIIACLPLLIESNNLALTFDANNSVCTASYTTCCSDVNTILNALWLPKFLSAVCKTLEIFCEGAD